MEQPSFSQSSASGLSDMIAYALLKCPSGKTMEGICEHIRKSFPNICASQYDPALILDELTTSQIFMRVKLEYSDQDRSCDWIIQPERLDEVSRHLQNLSRKESERRKIMERKLNKYIRVKKANTVRDDKGSEIINPITAPAALNCLIKCKSNSDFIMKCVPTRVSDRAQINSAEDVIEIDDSEDDAPPSTASNRDVDQAGQAFVATENPEEPSNNTSERSSHQIEDEEGEGTALSGDRRGRASTQFRRAQIVEQADSGNSDDTEHANMEGSPSSISEQPIITFSDDNEDIILTNRRVSRIRTTRNDNISLEAIRTHSEIIDSRMSIPNLPNSFRSLQQCETAFHQECMTECEMKPEWIYPEMIAFALMCAESKKLICSDICKFISLTFPYFRTAPEPWMSSVRHALSQNFEKLDEKLDVSKQRSQYVWYIHTDKLEMMQRKVCKRLNKDPSRLMYTGIPLDTGRTVWKELTAREKGEIADGFAITSDIPSRKRPCSSAEGTPAKSRKIDNISQRSTVYQRTISTSTVYRPPTEILPQEGLFNNPPVMAPSHYGYPAQRMAQPSAAYPASPSNIMFNNHVFPFANWHPNQVAYQIQQYGRLKQSSIPHARPILVSNVRLIPHAFQPPSNLGHKAQRR